MKKTYAFLLMICWSLSSLAQSEEKLLWEGAIQLGHQSLSLGIPVFSPINPGLGISVLRQWNQNPKHQLVQRGTFDFFVHQDLQNALRLHTEFGYRYRSEQGFQIVPLSIGGGFVWVFPNLTTVERDEAGVYQEVGVPTRQNWMIQLGPDIGYFFSKARADKGLGIDLSYRIQLQGTFANETVPVIAYAPLWIRLSVPF